jgi:ectoine hydroxylase-related dioxygenase (phytanoyl-CoA dioxygenase family)
MYTKQALRALGVTSDLPPAQKRELDEIGFIIVEDVISKADARRMAEEFERLHAAEKETGGQEVHVEPGARRLSNIFNKSSVFDPLLEIKPALAAAHYVLGEIKVHGANIRDPVQGHGHQQLHVDVPKKFPDDWWLVNAMILFDNGPTRVIPGSHHWVPINVPVVNQGDWEPTPLSPEDQMRVPEDLNAPYPGEVLVTAPAGAAVILNSSGWHAGTRKNSDKPRRLIHLSYTRRDLPQQLVQLDHLTRELYESGAPLSARDRAAQGRRRRASASEARPQDLVELACGFGHRWSHQR